MNFKILKINKKIVSLILIILLSNYVYAFAVSSTYWKDNPLELLPGETRNTHITLQNLVGENDITAKITISEGFEIARLTDSSNTYFIPFGTKKQVNLRVSIPNKTKIYNYNVKLILTTVEETGEFGLGSSIEHNIPVVVIRKGIGLGGLVLIILAIAAAGAIILVIYKNRKRGAFKKTNINNYGRKHISCL